MSRKARSGSEKPSRRSRSAGLAILIASTLTLVAGLGPGHTPSAQQPGPCDPPNSNPIACENQLAGSPESQWDVSGAGDESVQGFTTDISVNRGSPISFKVDTTASSIRLDIYRMGYYAGMGARLVTSLPATATNQPNCLTDGATGLVDCGNWSVSATWDVPATAVSGIYFAKAIRLDTQGASHIPFVVRNDSSNSDLLFQTSDTTWHAYNQYGGNSLYVGNPVGRAYKVSYNRPITVRGSVPEDSVFNAEYPMVRWLEANGYNVSYFSGVDTDRFGPELLEHKVFLSVGHDEYWSGTQRTNVETARAAGVHLAFFSGNEVFWKTRWENSISNGAAPRRTLVTYKETHANAKIDPLPNVWTGTWRDPRFSPPADGGRPENALTGTIFYVNSGTTGIRVPAAEGKMRFWRNTSIAGLVPGGFADLPFGTLGYEWDEDRDNGFRPAGLIRMSDTTVSGVDYLQDHGSTYAPGTANHALTLYKHPTNGALVFGAGTVQWSWGLDSNHDRGSAAPSPAMQQATVNLFADMGAQPVTLQGGLVVAGPSTDTVPPTSTIQSPANGAGVPANSTISIIGTATDNGGGVVGGVEVSVDGGTTWRRATGRENWTFSWQTGGPRVATIFSRAVDDSGNLASSGTGVSVTVGGGSATCPCSIWTPTQTPSVPAENDPSAVEVGTRFRSSSSGYITGIRFYKSAQNTGAHVGNLWTNTGTLLSSVNFTGESASGWQEATLPAPVQISANTTYVVSYHTNTGFYAGDDGYFASEGVQNGPLYAPRDGEFGDNGVYRYGASAFPNQTYQSESYWVDVVFVTSVGPDTTPPTVSGVSPANSASGVATSTTVSGTFSENLNASTVTSSTFELRDGGNALVTASVSFSAATRTATLTPSAALAYSTTYTARLRGGASGIKDTAGNALVSDFTWTFTTGAAPPPPPTEGPGGPILVVSTSGNPFSRYYAEILRAEGLNAFTAMDLSLVTSTVLSSYDVVILGEMALTTTEVTMFSNWVTAGGNLIAMRPDKKLASLLGLTDAAATLSEGYLLVNTAVSPGAGIVGQSMQYHGIADRYSLSGASSVATLYSNATTATSNPAVTLRSVGSSGGQAAAFAYDLARSIVYTRQGNPAWSGQERDGVDPIRSDDLFFGGAQADYVNLSKVAIPQADEQQRLLANMIGHMNSDRKLLPKFWYFPRGEKAVVVMTGDDHANNGTSGRFDVYKSNSPAGCNVNNWECVRATSYIYPTTPMSNAQAAAYVADGFELAPHITTGCGNYTPSSLQSNYANDLASFASFFPSVPAVRTNRTHCIAWSDYDTQPQVALANGIRLDTNYYYWPGTWVLDRPGFMTGSGMPMRFTRADGTIIDVYQAATQLTDESDQSWPFTIDTLLDRAIGAEGYYGYFTANMHTDTVAHEGSEAIVASALARSVPVISARQLLTWLDGRNGSSFAGITWNGSTLNFSIAVGTGATGLEAMVPASSGSASLVGITRSGSPVSYRLETIKGVAYAIFSASAGAHAVSYGSDSTPPVITGLGAVPSISDATISWTTNEASDTRVDYGTSPSALTSTVSSTALTTGHSIVLPGLASATTYYYRARSADGSGNATTSPALALAPATFTTTTPPSSNCPCSIWPATATPAVPSVQDASAVELGVKFRTSVNGFISGIRFYKGTQNTGTHTGNLWTSAGSPLASAVFSGESASGWQTVTFTTPVAVTAGTTYVASYHTTSGFYSADSAYFQSVGVVNGPLEALANGTAPGNGVYRYGTSGFPTDTFNSANYWVDVVFLTSAGGDTTPPVISGLAALAGTTSATVTWTTNEPATSRVDYGTTAGSLTANVSVAGVRTSHSVELTGLQPGLTYHYRATSVDAATNSVTQPTGAPATFATTQATFTVGDTSTADFSAGSAVSGVYVSETGNGEVILAPTLAAEFGGAVLPAGWTNTAWNTGGASTVSGGALLVDGARLHTDGLFGPGVSLEFVATFSTAAFEHAGLGVTLNETPWAIFSTGGGGALYARTHDGTAPLDTLLPGNWLSTPHLYRIDWTLTAVVFSIDGVQVASHPAAIAANMRPIVSNFDTGGTVLSVDWMRLSPYASSGTFLSRVLDGGSVRNWTSAAWTSTAGAETAATVSARFGNTAVPDGTWTAFAALSSSGGSLSQSSRYVQYQAGLTSSNPAVTPALADVTFTAGVSAPLPSISVSDASLTEGNSGSANMAVTLTLSSPSASVVSLAVATANGTATAGSDYTAVSTTASFAIGATSTTVNIPILGDTAVEPNEAFVLNLSAPVNATIADAQAALTIVNDDVVLPTLSINDVSTTEGATTATFTVTLAGTATNTVTVSYATANLTATSGSDYTATSGSISFPVGTTSRTVTVNVLADSLDENNETFTVNLSNPVNATTSDAQGTGTINDNDATPTISIGNVTVTEGNSGTVNAVLTVSLSTASGRQLSVNYATANNTATSGATGDYTAIASTTLTFDPGVTSRTVTVVVRGDVLDESNETFFVNLSNATNVSINDGQGTGTITDDDATPTVSINDVSIAEGDSGTRTATFTVTLSAASGRTVSMSYATASGTASSLTDYIAENGSVSFSPGGSLTQQITISVRGDNNNENNETFFVNLTNPSNVTIVKSQGVGTILDDE